MTSKALSEHGCFGSTERNTGKQLERLAAVGAGLAPDLCSGPLRTLSDGAGGSCPACRGSAWTRESPSRRLAPAVLSSISRELCTFNPTKASVLRHGLELMAVLQTMFEYALSGVMTAWEFLRGLYLYR